ncbi:MAG: site-2 protease family protein [Crocinitomicaceae bacterium]|nr:site-2 protease family protein [Crocinitomicaceae bacterium]
MDEYSFYPDKPQLETKKEKSGLAMTVFSMALFVFGMLFIFPDFFSFIILLLVVLLIHELGHFIFMKLFNYKNVRMLFIPLMGAFVSGFKDRYSQKQSFVVVLAGPIPGIILGIACFYYAQVTHTAWLMTISLLFLFLNVLNLLPLDPLDGGQLLRIIIRKNKDVFQFIFSLTSSLLMIGFGLYFETYLLIGFGFLMAFRVRSQQKNYQIRKELKEDDVQYETTYNDLDNKQYAQIKQIVLRHTPALEKYMSLNREEDIEPIVAAQVKNVLSPPMKYDASIVLRIGIVLLWVSAIVLPIVFLMNNNIDWYAEFLKDWK